jgi:alkyl sulfatase BDS1-like metallo-beta-lactamase superfamily hydrolase
VAAAKAGTADFVRGSTTEMFLDYLAILVDTKKAAGLQFKNNLLTPDNGEKFVIEMSNATLTSLAGYTAPDAELTITIDRSELEDVMIGAAKLVDKVKAGKARLEGNTQVLEQLKATLAAFYPFFEILPGTKHLEPESGFSPPFVGKL